MLSTYQTIMMRVIHISDLTFLTGHRQEIINLLINRSRVSPATSFVGCTLNELAQINDDSKTRKWFSDADYCTTDGFPLTIYAWLLTKITLERAYGPFIFADATKRAYQANLKQVYLCPSLSISHALKTYLSQKHILAKSSVTLVVPQANESLGALVKKVASLHPNIVWVSVGTPRQAQLAYLLKKTLRFGTIMCLGAAFELITGQKSMAPRWMQNIGLEWFYRLLREPKRLAGRYLISIPKFIVLTAQKKLLGKHIRR